MTQQLCSEDGCNRVLKARGLCSSHYDRARLAGTMDEHPIKNELVHYGETNAWCPNILVDANWPDGVCCCLTPEQVREFAERQTRKAKETRKEDAA